MFIFTHITTIQTYNISNISLSCELNIMNKINLQGINFFTGNCFLVWSEKILKGISKTEQQVLKCPEENNTVKQKKN